MPRTETLMASSATFDILGLEELQEDVRALLDKYPSEMEDELEKITTDFKKDVNKKFPHGGKSGKQKSISESWKKDKRRDSFTGMTMGAELTNQAPHFHLVENGHSLKVMPERYAAVQNGTAFHGQRNMKIKSNRGSSRLISLGFVQGKHYCEKTRNEWNNGEFVRRVEKRIDKFLKKHDL